MHRRRRADVVEGQDLVVLVDLPARDLAAHDLAEDAVLHRRRVHARDRPSRQRAAAFRRPRDAFSSMPGRAFAPRELGAARPPGPSPWRASSTRQWNHRSATSAAMRSLSPSFAAMTVSVASSPIFFRIASSPLREQRGDVGRARDRRPGALRSSRRAASRTSLARSAVSHGRRSPRGSLSTGSTVDPCAVVEPLEEAALAPGVAGDAARLLDDEQDRVVVAVEADLAHALHVAGLLALAPQLARASATSSAPRRVAAVRASASRFIHASVSTSLRRGVLRDRRHQAVGVQRTCVEPVHRSVVAEATVVERWRRAISSAHLDAGGAPSPPSPAPIVNSP